MANDPFLGKRRRLKILVLSDTYPWPARDGYRLRLDHVVAGLLEAGDVDLFAAIEPSPVPVGAKKPPRAIARAETAPLFDRRRDIRLAVLTATRPLPRRVLWRDWSSLQDRLALFVNGPYDIVWYSHVDSYLGLANPALGPAIVDFDNLEDVVARAQLSASTLHKPLRLREIGKRLLDLRDIPLWTRAQREIANRVACCVLCNDLDRARLGAPRTAIVPNGYDDPGRPEEDLPLGHVVVIVGLFRYGPNLSGAILFARKVLPRLRQLVPDAELHLVGRHDGALDELSGLVGVRLLGELADVAGELQAARVAVVPVLAGSGTRIKVLEALAYGVPIVTTSIGCEGIDVEPGEHVLVADDPAQMAEACARLLKDDCAARRLRVAGRARFLSRYQWPDIQRQVADLARAIASLG